MSTSSHDLPAALDFTSADLAANRVGEVTAAQTERLNRVGPARPKWRDVLNYALAAVVFGLLAAYFLSIRQPVPTVLMTLPTLLMLALLIRAAVQLNRPVPAFNAVPITGDVRVEENPINMPPLPLSVPLLVYHVQVGDQQFVVNASTAEYFKQHASTRHTLYFEPTTRIVLSAEPADAA